MDFIAEMDAPVDVSEHRTQIDSAVRMFAGKKRKEEDYDKTLNEFMDDLAAVKPSSSEVERVFSQIDRSIKELVDLGKQENVRRILVGFVGEAIVRHLIKSNLDLYVYDTGSDIVPYEIEGDEPQGVDLRIKDDKGRELKLQVKLTSEVPNGVVRMQNMHTDEKISSDENLGIPKNIRSKISSYKKTGADPDIVIVLGRGSGDPLQTTKDLFKKAWGLTGYGNDDLGALFAGMLEEMMEEE